VFGPLEASAAGLTVNDHLLAWEQLEHPRIEVCAHRRLADSYAELHLGGTTLCPSDVPNISTLLALIHRRNRTLMPLPPWRVVRQT
jgi:hypothetical protein